jgi:hypothetical protein
MSMSVGADEAGGGAGFFGFAVFLGPTVACCRAATLLQAASGSLSLASTWHEAEKLSKEAVRTLCPVSMPVKHALCPDSSIEQDPAIFNRSNYKQSKEAGAKWSGITCYAPTNMDGRLLFVNKTGEINLQPCI